MHRVVEGKLLSGFIYGDTRNKEYVYLPGSEIDTASPVFVYETEEERMDLSLEDALHIVEKRSLKLVKHPILGERTL